MTLSVVSFMLNVKKNYSKTSILKQKVVCISLKKKALHRGVFVYFIDIVSLTLVYLIFNSYVIFINTHSLYCQ